MFAKFLWLGIISFSLAMNAQQKSEDITLITTTIENYFDGYIHRDGTLLHKAFDMENGAMKVLRMNEDGIEIVENSYFKELIPLWASREKLPDTVLSQTELKVLAVDIVDEKIGSAKIRMKVGETTYIDILSLHKILGQWKITNKSFIIAE